MGDRRKIISRVSRAFRRRLSRRNCAQCPHICGYGRPILFQINSYVLTIGHDHFGESFLPWAHLAATKLNFIEFTAHPQPISPTVLKTGHLSHLVLWWVSSIDIM